MADQFTTRTQEALQAAVRDAAGRGNAHVEPVHVLRALLDQRDGIAVALIAGLGADVEALARQAERAVAALPGRVRCDRGQRRPGPGHLQGAEVRRRPRAHPRATRSSPPSTS